MGNLRVIYNNAIDRAVLTASSTAGSLVATNMQRDVKSAVWRSVGTTASVTATWTTAEVVGGVMLPFCNLTSLATIRVRGYTNVGDANPVFDTGTIAACPYAPLGLWGWGSDSLGVNAFSYGGGTYGRVWIDTPAAVKKIVIDLVDAGNPAGYLEVSRIVAGNYWEPEVGVEQGATVTVVDSSKHFRTDAGDQYTDVGTRHRKQTLALPSLDTTDRGKMWDILWGNGMTRPIFISLYPNDADVRLEQSHQLYGKLVSTPIMGTPYFRHHSASIDIEEI